MYHALFYTGPLADLWTFNPASSNWTDLTSSARGDFPSPRVFFGMATAGERLFIFGGKNETAFLGDLKCWDPATGYWTDLSSSSGDCAPAPRAYHSFAEHGGLLFLFGGWGYSGTPPPPAVKQRVGARVEAHDVGREK